MNTSNWIALIVACIAFIGGIFAIASFILYAGGMKKDIERIPELEKKIEELYKKLNMIWGIFLFKGEAELLRAGMATKNSPYKSSSEALSILEPFHQEIKDFAATLSSNISHNNLAMEIGFKFGERLIQEVCVPKNLNFDMCLLIAADFINPNREVVA